MRWNKRALKLRWSWKMNTYKTCTQTRTHTHSEAKWKRNKVNSTTTSDIKSLKNYYFATQINPTHLSQVQHVHTLTHFVSKACFLRIYIPLALLSALICLLKLLLMFKETIKNKREAIHTRTQHIISQPVCSRVECIYCTCARCLFFFFLFVLYSLCRYPS